MADFNKRCQEKQQIFRIFLKKLDLAYSEFCIWRELQNRKYNQIFNKNKCYWTTILSSLYGSFSADLAKLTEKPTSWRDDTISIFSLLIESELSDYDETLEKIGKLRNKVLMHIDKKTYLSLNDFMKTLNLKYGDIEDIFAKLIDILDKIKCEFHNSTSCKEYFSKLEESCKTDVKELMNILLESCE